MTKRVKRFAGFDLNLNIKSDDFIRTPRDAQRSWLLNRSMNEFSHDINALDRHASGFVPGSDFLPTEDRTQAELEPVEIMEDWQIPIMAAMAGVATAAHGDVLEIGFGRGIASSLIQEGGVNSHTIIECNDSIVASCREWMAEYPGEDINVVTGLWQEVLDGLSSFDAVFFHTYPLNETDYLEQIASSITFAEHFFPHAAAHLRPGGVFTYLSNEIDSLSREHQRQLLKHFSSIEISIVKDLNLPENLQDQWWSDSMAIVKAVK